MRLTRAPGKRDWFEIWDGLPYLVRPGEQKPCDVLPAKDAEGLRAYIAGKLPDRWIWKAYRPEPAEIVFTHTEREFARFGRGAIVIEPNLKAGASPNKNWGWDRWQALVRSRPDLPWLQLGPAGTRLLDAVRHLKTPSFRHAAAALGAARAAVLTEGGLHHAAAAVGTPAVVIFGGFIGPRVTGYDTQRSLFESVPHFPLGCGYRVPCEHCARAMAAITPPLVLNHLEEVLRDQTSRDMAA